MAGHNHCAGSCDHNHDHEAPERGQEYSLYMKIDLHNVECLNEARDGSGKDVFKPWEERLSTEKTFLVDPPKYRPKMSAEKRETTVQNRLVFIESDADEELLLNIPFTGNIKLKGIIVIGGEGDEHPSEMRLFKNRPHMTFDEASKPPDQIFEMQPDRDGSLEYEPKIVKFSSVQHLTMHFPKNFGGDVTKIYYIGFKGEYSEAHRHEVTVCTYESRAMPSDHKAGAFNDVHHEIN